VAVGASVQPGLIPALTISRATRWDAGVPTDLLTQVTNPDGWQLEDARGINEAGTIIGMGRLHGERHGFLLVPVPATPPVVTPPDTAPVPEDKDVMPDKHSKPRTRTPERPRDKRERR